MNSPGLSATSALHKTRREFLGMGLGTTLLTAALGMHKLAVGKPLVETSTSGNLNYHPEGLCIWDIWFFTRGEELHLLHLQKKLPESQRPDRDDGTIGHAVSTDLLTWKELPIALYRGPPGSIDDEDLFTGCAVVHQGKYYMFYTARRKSAGGRIQRICLATSEDGINWTKHPQPVIVPDPRWYTEEDCRDMIVVQHPETREFHGFYAAGLPRAELVEKTTIAHVRSPDLIYWIHEPPVFTSTRHAVVECPDVFYLNGHWWLTCNAGHLYGARAGFSDPYVTWGTMYARSDRLEGPYVEGEDNALIGSMEFNGFCCRTAEWKGRRYLFYGQAERRGRVDHGDVILGTLATPKELVVTPEGRLRPRYCNLIEQRASEELIAAQALPRLEEVGGRFGTGGEWNLQGNRVQANSRRSWSVRLCGPEAESFIWSVDLALENGRAIGLLFRDSLAVTLDFHDQCVMFTRLPELHRLDSRKVCLQHGRTYRVRIIAKAEFCEVYVDDHLILQFVRYRPKKGRSGLYIESGDGTFTNLSMRSLRV